MCVRRRDCEMLTCGELLLEGRSGAYGGPSNGDPRRLRPLPRRHRRKREKHEFKGALIPLIHPLSDGVRLNRYDAGIDAAIPAPYAQDMQFLVTDLEREPINFS